MSKSLEALIRIINHLDYDSDYVTYDNHKGDIELIEKELEALKIIKENLKYDISYNPTDNEYYIDTAIRCKDKEEYDLLKEVLL